jgi:hypothetical protein
MSSKADVKVGLAIFCWNALCLNIYLEKKEQEKPVKKLAKRKRKKRLVFEGCNRCCQGFSEACKKYYLTVRKVEIF